MREASLCYLRLTKNQKKEKFLGQISHASRILLRALYKNPFWRVANAKIRKAPASASKQVWRVEFFAKNISFTRILQKLAWHRQSEKFLVPMKVLGLWLREGQLMVKDELPLKNDSTGENETYSTWITVWFFSRH